MADGGRGDVLAVQEVALLMVPSVVEGQLCGVPCIELVDASGLHVAHASVRC